MFVVALSAVGVIVSAVLGIGGWEESGLSFCSLGSAKDVYIDSFMQLYSDALDEPAREAVRGRGDLRQVLRRLDALGDPALVEEGPDQPARRPDRAGIPPQQLAVDLDGAVIDPGDGVDRREPAVGLLADVRSDGSGRGLDPVDALWDEAVSDGPLE